MVNEHGLTKKQQIFCELYVLYGNATRAAREAGYSTKTAQQISKENLLKPLVQKEIERLSRPILEKEAEEKARRVASSREVMEFFTKAMNGEIKDQFGLDASLGDKIKAAQELAKRTVDIENKQAGIADNRVEIVVDWKRD